MTKRTGPKNELGGQPVERVTVTLDEMTRRKLKVVGDGNTSMGIRIAADLAYDRYQRGHELTRGMGKLPTVCEAEASVAQQPEEPEA